MRILATVGVLTALMGAGATLQAASADQAASSPDRVQVAANKLHPVTVAIDVNNGDAKTAEDVLVTIEPVNAKDDPAKTTLKGPGKVELAEGAYRVTVQLNDTVKEGHLAVAGPTEHLVELDVGFVTLSLRDTKSKKKYTKDVEWKIMTWKKDSHGNRRLISVPDGAQPLIILPNGAYVAEVTYKNGWSKRLTFDVNEGRVADVYLWHQ